MLLSHRVWPNVITIIMLLSCEAHQHCSPCPWLKAAVAQASRGNATFHLREKWAPPRWIQWVNKQRLSTKLEVWGEVWGQGYCVTPCHTFLFSNFCILHHTFSSLLTLTSILTTLFFSFLHFKSWNLNWRNKTSFPSFCWKFYSTFL